MDIELLDDHLHQIPEEKPPMVPFKRGQRLLLIFFEYISAIFLIGLPLVLVGEHPLVIISLITIFLLNKDAIGGKSLVKRMSSAKLVDIRTGKAPPPVRASLRNLTAFLVTFEILSILFSKKGRRIGDYFCYTMVVQDKIPKHKTTWREDLKKADYYQLLLAHIIYIVPPFVMYYFYDIVIYG